jgi:hypothetical protein
VASQDLHRVASGPDLDVLDSPPGDLLLEVAPEDLYLN